MIDSSLNSSHSLNEAITTDKNKGILLQLLRSNEMYTHTCVVSSDSPFMHGNVPPYLEFTFVLVSQLIITVQCLLLRAC
jgi:hypothetical protein